VSSVFVVGCRLADSASSAFYFFAVFRLFPALARQAAGAGFGFLSGALARRIGKGSNRLFFTSSAVAATSIAPSSTDIQRLQRLDFSTRGDQAEKGELTNHAVQYHAQLVNIRFHCNP